jgi:heme-degrading monooxygenase HmoA
MTSRRTVQELPLGSFQPAERPMTAPFEDVVAAKVTARAVEFIAKPGKTDELRGFLCQAVTPILRDRIGFIRTMVLTTHGAPRRVMMITFWKTERRVRNLWEESPVVHEKLSALIDTAPRTSTYQVDLTETPEAPSQTISMQVANRSRISPTVRQQFA